GLTQAFEQELYRLAVYRHTVDGPCCYSRCSDSTFCDAHHSNRHVNKILSDPPRGVAPWGRLLFSSGDSMRHVITVLGVVGISAALMASPVRAWELDQLPPSYTLGLNAVTAQMGVADGAGGVIGNVATGSTLGVDTIPTFDSYFYDP